MTDTNPHPLTQADRDAAEECCNYFLTRHATCNIDVEEMFARHRIKHSTPDRNVELEEAADILREMWGMAGHTEECAFYGDGECNCGFGPARDRTRVFLARLDTALTTTPEPKS